MVAKDVDVPTPREPGELCPHCNNGIWRLKLIIDPEQAGDKPELPAIDWTYCTKCKAILIGAHDLRLQHEGDNLIPLLIPYRKD